jgi:hypothetical protein
VRKKRTQAKGLEAFNRDTGASAGATAALVSVSGI